MRQKLDIVDVEQRTKIRAKYLRALENEEWGTLPGPTFVKTFLRTYADVVGVDAYLLVEEYRTKHDPGEEPDTTARAGQPAVSRRQAPRRQAPRRQAPRRRPPRRPPPVSLARLGAVVAGLVVTLVAFLYVLGLVGEDDEPASERAATDETRTETKPKPKARPKPAPAPKGVTVRVAPTFPTYACLDAGEGTEVVFEGTLEEPRTFKNAERLRVNLGKRSVDMRVNGKPVQIAPSPEPVGFDLTPKGATEIVEGTRPCA